MVLKFSTKILAGKSPDIYQISAEDKFWQKAIYFILVKPGKRHMLEKCISRGKIDNLEKYGEILASCYGNEPTDKIKKLLKQKYNYDVI